MRCPGCGTEMAEGTAYCSNPSCGAVPGQAPQSVRHIKIEKNIKFNFKLNFVTLARLAALLIAVLAFAYLYFGAKVHKLG